MRGFLKSTLLWILFLPGIALAKSLDPIQITQFIDFMVEKHDFDAEALNKIFSKTAYSDKVLQAISRPAEGLPWHQYRKIFLQDKRIKGGIQFWQKHEKALNKAINVYGVPAEIIIAIIGVETQYGKNQGKYKVIDSLATLAFHFPKRSKFFRSELEQFLLLTREQGADPLSLKGSYAGAMGISQFISSSYRNYAVDFDGDGKKDLWQNPIDAIGSVANYLSQHNWQRDQSVVIHLKEVDSKISEMIDSDLRPNIRLEDLQKYDIVLEYDLPETVLLQVIKFEEKDHDKYWLGMYNFYVITRYNHSILYAMAVYQLSGLIKAGYERLNVIRK